MDKGGASTRAQVISGGGVHRHAAFGSDEGRPYNEAPRSEREGFSGVGLRRVLIVEDEAIIAMEIEDLLLELGYEVVAIAMNAEDAIKVAAEHQPDLVTMDINLGRGRDGISAAIEIFERLGIRSIFISAYGGPEPARRAEPAQPFGWITKPIDRSSLGALLAKVSSALSRDDD